jgi:hypothetical protein
LRGSAAFCFRILVYSSTTPTVGVGPDVAALVIVLLVVVRLVLWGEQNLDGFIKLVWGCIVVVATLLGLFFSILEFLAFIGVLDYEITLPQLGPTFSENMKQNEHFLIAMGMILFCFLAVGIAKLVAKYDEQTQLFIGFVLVLVAFMVSVILFGAWWMLPY